MTSYRNNALNLQIMIKNFNAQFLRIIVYLHHQFLHFWIPILPFIFC
jgi:hypothetical protein